MGYLLGNESRANLVGVHPDLVHAVEIAIILTTQDFRAYAGLRSLNLQRTFVANGTSWTMNSKHLRQPDGFGHAVDLVPIIQGKLKWDWPACCRIAAAMAAAATQLRIALRWGGVWDRAMSAYAGSPAAMAAEVVAYMARRRKMGRRAAIDGPHFELIH